MLYYLILIYFIAVAIPIIISIIYDKREPVKSLSWILVVVFLPFIGSFLYFSLGQDLRKRKIFHRKHIEDFQYTDYIIYRQMYEINSLIFDGGVDSIFHRDIGTLLLNNNRAPLFRDEKVEVLSDGRSCFDSIIEALQEARIFIHFEFYIIRDDKIGNEIADILCQKSREGVEVRIIYDGVGSWGLSKKYINKLRDAGVEIYPFMPVILPKFTNHINYRNHRKIIVVDGKVGFTGGMNVADKYIEGLSHIGIWRDLHLKIEGKSIATLQRIFMVDWSFVSGKKLNVSVKYFPPFKKIEGGIATQIASSGPDSEWATIMQAFFAAITKAKEYIHIATPYFTPNPQILTALKVAALCGIDVKLIIPGNSDSKLVLWATRSFITELINSKVKVYFYRGGFIHSKLLLVDGEFCSVGSANMDIRSFDDNFEVTAFIYDKAKSEELEQIFQEDLSNSRRVIKRWWLNRPLLHRFYESMARLLSPLL